MSHVCLAPSALEDPFLTLILQMQSIRRMSMLDRVEPPSRQVGSLSLRSVFLGRSDTPHPSPRSLMQSPWSVVRDAIYSGRTQEAAKGNAPGLQGKSKLVAKVARKGVDAVIHCMCVAWWLSHVGVVSSLCT